MTEGQQLAKNMHITGGTSPSVDIYAEQGFSALIEKGKEAALEKELVLLENVTAPLKEGDVVGYLKITLDGKEIGRVNAIVTKDVGVLDFETHTDVVAVCLSKRKLIGISSLTRIFASCRIASGGRYAYFDC